MPYWLCEVHLWSEHVAVVGGADILWFRDVTTPLVNLGQGDPPPHGQAYMAGGLDVTTPLSHLENMKPPPPTDKRQGVVDFALQLPWHCFWFLFGATVNGSTPLGYKCVWPVSVRDCRSDCSVGKSPLILPDTEGQKAEYLTSAA